MEDDIKSRLDNLENKIPNIFEQLKGDIFNEYDNDNDDYDNDNDNEYETSNNFVNQRITFVPIRILFGASRSDEENENEEY
jgi:hypothetical protein